MAAGAAPTVPPQRPPPRPAARARQLLFMESRRGFHNRLQSLPHAAGHTGRAGALQGGS